HVGGDGHWTAGDFQLLKIEPNRHQGSRPHINEVTTGDVARVGASLDEDLSFARRKGSHGDVRGAPLWKLRIADREQDGVTARKHEREPVAGFASSRIEGREGLSVSAS